MRKGGTTVSMGDITILLTGCGSEGAYGVIKSLRANAERSIRMIGIDTNSEIANRYAVDEYCIPPRRSDPNFIPFVAHLARRKGVDVIFPIPTLELEMFAAKRSLFEAQGQRVIVSSEESLRVANNKALLFRWMNEKGFPCTPHFRTVQCWEDFVSAVQVMGYPGRRACFKPPVSTGAQGFRVLDASTNRLELLLNAPPASTITNLEALRDVLASAYPFPELVVMEYLPGVEYDVDVLVNKGKVLSMVPRRNRRMWYGMSLFCTTEYQQEIMRQTEEIVVSLGLSYVVSLSFKMDGAGAPKLIEINPRIPGSIISATMAGVNMPYLAVKLALGETVDIPPILWGTEMVRHWEEFFLSPEGKVLRSKTLGEV